MLRCVVLYCAVVTSLLLSPPSATRCRCCARTHADSDAEPLPVAPTGEHGGLKQTVSWREEKRRVDICTTRKKENVCTTSEDGGHGDCGAEADANRLTTEGANRQANVSSAVTELSC